MDTQNTPIHIKLWHSDFWRLTIACFLLEMCVFMFVPFSEIWVPSKMDLSFFQKNILLGCYPLGLFLLAPFVNYLIQKKSRNKICIYSVFFMGITVLLSYSVEEYLSKEMAFPLLIVLRVLFSSFFALAQIVLMGTLIVDICESFQRTEANHHVAWFARFAISIGPLLTILLMKIGINVMIGITLVALVVIILISSVRFPFKAPEENPNLISTDRFFLVEGKWLFVNLLLIAMVLGLLLAIEHDLLFYSLLMPGFFIAILSEKYVFADAELRSETVTGLLLIASAIVMLITRNLLITTYLIPLFLGMGFGLIGSRFLLFFIKLKYHCQRATSLSTYLLSWESGIGLGLLLGYVFLHSQRINLLYFALTIVCVAFCIYHFFVHDWYLLHKNR